MDAASGTFIRKGEVEAGEPLVRTDEEDVLARQDRGDPGGWEWHANGQEALAIHTEAEETRPSVPR